MRCDDDAGELNQIVAWARATRHAGAGAVLMRVNDQIGPVEQALLGAGLTVAVFGAAPFAARAGIRAALATLALAANPRDRLAFARTASAAGRGAGPAAGTSPLATSRSSAAPRVGARRADPYHHH